MFTKVKTRGEIKNMRISGQMLASILNVLKAEVSEGMSTKDIADIVRREQKAIGAKPAFLGFDGFSEVICISVNDEVVHGIPKKNKIIGTGDIVGLDYGVDYHGMKTDAAISVIVGKARSEQDKILVRDTYNSLMAGINVVKDKVRTGDIGNAIESSLDKKYGIVKSLVGHGVGHNVHEDPNIPNYGRKGSGPFLYAGMTIAIEPMVTLGTDQVSVDPDMWTIRTKDGSMSAHFEHTVLITEDGYEIITTLD